MGNKKENNENQKNNSSNENKKNFQKSNQANKSYSQNSSKTSSQKQNSNTIKPYKKTNNSKNNNQINSKSQSQNVDEYRNKNNYKKNNNYNKNKNQNRNNNSNKSQNRNNNQNNNQNKNNNIKKNSYKPNNKNQKSNYHKSDNVISKKQNENITKNVNKNDEVIKDNKIENKEKKNIEPIKIEKKETENSNNNIEQTKNNNKSKLSIIFIIIIISIILVIVIMFMLNLVGNKISNNVSIENIDVSKLTYAEAKNKIENEYNNILENNKLIYTYNDSEYEINLEDIEFSYLFDESVSQAMNITRNANIFESVKDYYSLKFGNKKNVELNFEYNSDKLNQKIKEIENNFYRDVKQYSYAIEDNKIKIKNGISGIKIVYDEFEDSFKNAIETKNLESKIEIPVYIEEPDAIDITKIHKEIYVEMANAYYTTEPFEIHNEVKGVNFDVSLLNQMIMSDPEKEEYIIDLIYTEPEIKVGDLDLYNDTLGKCSTAYVNNPNRTTNLRLAASKIDGMILMPGESFSYNDVVGERTVSAGYKNAAIYINGEVEDGLAGGICQISSTLYDAVVYSNLEVTERHNHARVPSYLGAGKDATVYWGSKDFKFKNNRNYPIKISITVSGGYATATIYGKKVDNEYDISFETSVVGRSNGYMKVNTYKVYRQNGAVVNREYLYTDSYKV